MKTPAKLISCIVFPVILAASLTIINRTLEPKYTLSTSDWPTTSTFNQFYRMDRDSIEVLFFGSSIAASAFVPQVLYDEYGMTSYNLACELQNIFFSYYWLEEALHYQSPRAVVLDLEFMNDYYPENRLNTKESISRKSIDPMRWSLNKVKAVHHICTLDRSQSELSYYLTNIRYHSRWPEVSLRDLDIEMTENAPLKGFAPVNENAPEEAGPYIPGRTDEKYAFQEVMQEYLDRIVKLCREKGISLMLVSLPGDTMNDSINFTHESYADGNGILYLNMCTPEQINRIGAFFPEENIYYHENIWGAVKTSRYIGALLAENYEIEPLTDPQYESSKEYFRQILDSFNLTRITDAGEYRRALERPYFRVFETTDDTINIDGEEFRSEDSGVNIVVYDLNMQRVMDFVTLQGQTLIRHY